MKADRIVVGMHSQDGSVSPLDVRLAIDARCPVLVVDGTLTEPMKAGALVHIRSLSISCQLQASVDTQNRPSMDT